MTAIIEYCEQGSAEWVDLRLGVPTASEFRRIVTAAGRLSSQRDEYIAELVAEWLHHEPFADWQGNDWTERGKALEPQAFESYAWDRGHEVKKCGFVWKDKSRRVGCSPDGLPGPGIVEMKCPSAKWHCYHVIFGRKFGGIPTKYRMQIQAQLWVTGRPWADFYSWHPDYPPYLFRCAPDPMLHEALDTHMPKFLDELDEAKQEMKSLMPDENPD